MSEKIAGGRLVSPAMYNFFILLKYITKKP